MQRVSEIMTPNPGTCEPNEPITNALEIMRRENCGAVPIVDKENRIKNMITDRDIALCLLETLRDIKDVYIHDCVGMERTMITVRPEDDIHRALDLMEEHQVRRLPVVDDQIRCVGILAQADIALKDRKPEDIVELIHDISEERESIGSNP